jgi:Gluconate 2-dehydrogenase subunit 3
MREVLSVEQRTVLQAAAQRLIPDDASGPGAGEAGAIAYLERALAGPYAAHHDAYRNGVAALEAASAARGGGFAELEPAQQDAVLASFEGSEEASERAFFELLRAHVIEGMFGDPAWGGNIGRAGWGLLDYPGPRRVWTEREQQLGDAP